MEKKEKIAYIREKIYYVCDECIIHMCNVIHENVTNKEREEYVQNKHSYVRYDFHKKIIEFVELVSEEKLDEIIYIAYNDYFPQETLLKKEEVLLNFINGILEILGKNHIDQIDKFKVQRSSMCDEKVAQYIFAQLDTIEKAGLANYQRDSMTNVKHKHISLFKKILKVAGYTLHGTRTSTTTNNVRIAYTYYTIQKIKI